MSSFMNSNKKQQDNSKSSSSKRFPEACDRKLFDSKKTLTVDCSSSSEDEEELDETHILKLVYQYYPKFNEDAKKNLQKMSGCMENLLHSGAVTCLICIGSVRRTDSIWSCKHCYCIFHLQCIGRWANDSIAQSKKIADQVNAEDGYYNYRGEYIPPKRVRTVNWCCPQCRREYKPEERPNEYRCFCGKERNPKQQTWLVPHSCGEVCGKRLKPECGHTCLLLCHPGACPPCAQIAINSCLCGKSSPKTMRCLDKQWQCERKCTSRLACSDHVCNQVCHKPGNCPPCKNTSLKACECGNEKKRRNCSDPKWHCQKACNLLFQCGIHRCQRVCHADWCGDCPLSLPRSCPCGKTKKIGPCTDTIDTCGDTCQKLLSCGLHKCAQRCHQGVCNLCFEIIKKKCRCGLYEKELPCCKEFICETKCKKMRGCGKHTCNKKCCDGCCPPCDKVCGKLLSCKKHRCQSICHDGPCYPCEESSSVKCRCGKTTKEVPCGRERSARIICTEICRIPSKCHHPNKHRCHKNECPTCTQKCGLINTTSGCGHVCDAKCHGAVKVLKKVVPDPHCMWSTTRTFEFIRKPHPRCEKIISVTCFGGHEISECPCWNSKSSSCFRKCGRLLNCGNHKCENICHPVPDIRNKNEQAGCGSCEEKCSLPRPIGCMHTCPLPCHMSPCPPCNNHIKPQCHCGINQVIFKCSDFYNCEGTEADIAKHQERLRSCGNRCLRNFPCGHRCINICHSGECTNAELCRKKIRIFCQCKRLKADIPCDKYRMGLQYIDCDDHCAEALAKNEQEKKEAEEKLRLQEEQKNRLEVEQFEKKFGKRKPKERKAEIKKEVKEINWKKLSIYVGVTLAVALAIGVAVYETK